MRSVFIFNVSRSVDNSVEMKRKIITSIFGWNERERKSEGEKINKAKKNERERENYITNSKQKCYAILSAFTLRIFYFVFNLLLLRKMATSISKYK